VNKQNKDNKNGFLKLTYQITKELYILEPSGSLYYKFEIIWNSLERFGKKINYMHVKK
jgi:hypothetical protein